MATVKYPEPLIFGLDIGTRSIVGTVGYREQERFHVVAMAVKYHDTRSMIDGQIHDIAKVSQDIVEVKQQLEKQLGGRKLHDVCIAAAGRVLKTAIGHGEYEFSENTVITQEYIHSIDLIGVEQAHNEILQELNESHETTKYFCVGYTVVKYFLNNYEITNLEGHKGTKIAADVLATFLPEEVVDSLYAAVEQAGLYVTNLTLEPIAAMTVAIPEQYRLLNIALIDIGAGTSDICITKDGSVIAYGMIPAAGDELTEALVTRHPSRQAQTAGRHDSRQRDAAAGRLPCARRGHRTAGRISQTDGYIFRSQPGERRGAGMDQPLSRHTDRTRGDGGILRAGEARHPYRRLYHGQGRAMGRCRFDPAAGDGPQADTFGGAGGSLPRDAAIARGFRTAAPQIHHPRAPEPLQRSAGHRNRQPQLPQEDTRVGVSDPDRRTGTGRSPQAGAILYL